MKFKTLIPEFTVDNLQQSIYFYVNMLGFKHEYTIDENKCSYLSYNDAQIMIEQVNKSLRYSEIRYHLGIGVNLQFEVPNIDELFTQLNSKHYPIHVPPEDVWYKMEDKLTGNREFIVKDPDGYTLRFSQDLGFKDIAN